jgi:ribosomal protein S18 acetylase RimI-like enzyme
MPRRSAPFAVRPYRPSDELGWLRCRVLAFLDTQYYDDVAPRRTDLPESAISLVAVTRSNDVVGILVVVVDGRAATIDTIATHPDHRGVGIATALFDATLSRLEHDEVTEVDAWTREDVAANRWYRRIGFSESHRYLHIYLGDGDDDTGFTTPDGLSSPVSAFVHGRIEDEARMRARFRRVYVCRRYVRKVVPAL